MRYKISLAGVKEVNLLGYADLSYFREALAPEGLHPTVREGRAEVSIGAFDSRFLGFGFREAVITVHTCDRPGGSERNGIFLFQGFNSRPFFAWVERVRNRCPYVAASVAVRVEDGSSSMAVAVGGTSVFDAGMAGHAAPLRTEDAVWEGPIFLPTRAGTGRGEMFLARLGGSADVYSFAPERDRWSAGDAAIAGASRVLGEHRFEPHEWWIRRSASHAKTKTMARR